MIEWVLIAALWGSGNFSTVIVFDDKQACVNAANELMAKKMLRHGYGAGGGPEAICVPRATTPRKPQ